VHVQGSRLHCRRKLLGSWQQPRARRTRSLLLLLARPPLQLPCSAPPRTAPRMAWV
jgi:hypothetical protein